MTNITELTDRTTSYELFTHVYWCIIARRITGFSDLVEYLGPVEEGVRKDYVLKAAFPLIREIHWGFFRELNVRAFPVLWGQLTRPHPRYSFAGELKLSMTLTDIYCGFIDIHGYTALSKSSKDASLLRLLDICIENDVKQICRDNHVVANRARGDEIILIGTSAYDVLNCVVMIADYFGDKNLTGDSDIVRRRNRDRVKLPEMSVSAGVAGGKKYDTLLITAGGDLSGPVVNTAARLQSRANRISDRDTRILITETVRIKYETEEKKQFAPMFSRTQIAFLDVGTFAFKGVDLRLTELIVDGKEMYRLEYQEPLRRFLETLAGDNWNDGLFKVLGELLAEACSAMPDFLISGPEIGEKRPKVRNGTGNDAAAEITNASLKALIHRVIDRFDSGRDYQSAATGLSEAVEAFSRVPGIDHFLVLYATAVAAEYRRIFEAYENLMTEFVEDRKAGLLNSSEKREYEAAAVGVRKRDELVSVLHDRVDADRRKKLWGRLIKDMKPSLGDALYLGK